MTNFDDFRQRIEKLSPKRLALLALEMHAKLQHVERQQNEPIAIVGMGCRIPGAEAGPEAFWELLRKGSDAIGDVPSGRWDSAAYYDPDPDVPGRISTRWGGFLSQIDCFDAAFFGIAGREAISMDPQQRLLLEVCWEALENAGYSPRGLKGTQTGVFIGIGSTDYHRILLERGENAIDAYLASGSSPAIAAGRISYTMGLHGPSLAVDTACSASLVSVHLACQSLRAHECHIGLAGGVNAVLLPDTTIGLSRAHMMAADGRCKTFDSRADGFVRGEGCGMVVILKRLSEAIADRDHILAVIRSSAVNQDGRSSGITAPNGAAQELLLREALSAASVEGHEIDYVETHGTGTSLGDPIEAHALAAIYGANRSSSHPLVVGAVKTNIGHLESAAGIAGLMKAVLSLQHEQIPANLHFQEMNPHIDWAGAPVRIPVEAVAWPRSDRPRRAGVSSFGFSGTNAHVIVEEAPEEAAAQRERERPAHLLVLSARSEAALGQLAQRYSEALEGLDADVGDICYTAGAGRSHFTHRLAVTGSSRGQLRERLLGALPGKAVREREGVRAVFLFPGQGAQYAGMGRELYESQPVFRRTLEECAELLKGKLEKPLLEVLWGGSTELLEQTAYTQPSLFAIEYALSELWRSWGIEPGAVLGHSVGEYVAACVAGMCTLGEGLQLIALRGRLMQGAKGRGAMAAVRSGEDRVRLALQGLEGRVTVAAINAPESVVISGYEAEVEEAGRRLSREGIGVQRLSVSHGFHSPQMEEMEEEFAAAAGEVRWKEPRLVLISSVTGRALAAGEMSEPGYWRRQVRQAVRFREGMAALAGYQTFVEAGPGSTLSGLGQQCLEGGERLWVQSLRKNRGEWEQMLGALGSLYVQGAEVNWAGYDEPYARRRVPLPTYPFERQRYWVDVKGPQGPRGVSATQDALSEAVSVSDNVDQCTYEISWQVRPLKPIQRVPGFGRWLIVSDGHGLAAAFANRIRDLGGAPVTARPDEIDTSLASSDVVVYLASPDRYASRELDADTMETGLSESLAGLLPLAKWVTAGERGTRLWVVTSGAQAVTVGEPPAHCLQAALWGVARTFALENPDSWGGIVDLDPGAALDGSSALLLDAILQNDGEDQTAIRNGQRYVPRLQNRTLSQYPDPVFSGDKVYLITGGLGGLGLLVTRWMADHGARKLALLGRRPPSAEASEVLESLRAGGVQAETYAVDIAQSSELAEVFRKIVAMQGPICGVMHLAGVLDDGMLVQQSWDRFARVLAPKTLGAWNLHHLTLNSGPLDFFVLFSSFASVTGSFGQANYAAANAVLDALAHYRKAHGLTATSLNWGGWAEAGMAARTVARGKSQAGAQLLPPKVALAALGRALAAALPQVGVAVIDWTLFSRAHPGQKFLEQVAATTEHTGPLPETAKPKSFLDQFRQIPKEERSRRLLDHLTQLLAQVLGVPPESLNPQTDITDFGLDSLMALELRNQITADLGVSIPVVRLLEGLSLAGLQIWITGQVVEAVEDPQPMASTGAETEFPLSYGQHAGLFGHKMLPEFAFSNVALTAKASPPLDRAAFRRSVERMTERHAILRTVFLEDQEGQQVQRVLSSVSPPAEFIDAAGWTDGEIRERLQEDFGRPFDVTRPMFSIKVFEQRDADVIYFKVDHLIIDHWSVGIFIEDLREIYSAEVAGRHHNLPPIEAEYRDFVEWERNLMSSPAADRMWAYWQKTLSGVPDLCLPSSRPRPDVLLAQGECIRIHIDAASFQEIKRAARKHRCTAYTFLLAAFHLLLHMYTNQEDVIVGTSIAGRDNPRWLRTMGLFINIVPIRGDLSGSPSFSELVGRIREAVLGAMEHSEFPFAVTLGRMRMPRTLQRLPLYQAFFNYLTERSGELRSLFMGIEVGDVQFGRSTLHPFFTMPQEEGRLEIALQLAEVKDHLVAYLNYNVQILDAQTASSMAESYRKILLVALQAPDMTIRNMNESIALETDNEELIL